MKTRHSCVFKANVKTREQLPRMKDCGDLSHLLEPAGVQWNSRSTDSIKLQCVPTEVRFTLAGFGCRSSDEAKQVVSIMELCKITTNSLLQAKILRV